MTTPGIRRERIFAGKPSATIVTAAIVSHKTHRRLPQRGKLAGKKETNVAFDRREILVVAPGASQFTPYWAVLVNVELRPNGACQATPKSRRN
jgi:hypothetical protein